MIDRSNFLTEQRLPESSRLDTLPILDAVDLMNQQDAAAVAAVGRQREAIAAAVKLVTARLGDGGRLIYVGAGTSGRLGVLDASEIPPTFGLPADRVQAIIAGGPGAVFKSVEGAEDDRDGAVAALDALHIDARDAVLGIAAGGSTPFVHGALAHATARGSATLLLTCCQSFAGEPAVDVVIRPLVGPEVVTGSTRLKAGTATKLVLNTLTTLSMVQLGKVYQNLMVDLRATNRKLVDRAVRIVMTVCQVDRASAQSLLDRAAGEVKTALVMHHRQLSADDARARLSASGGRVRDVL